MHKNSNIAHISTRGYYDLRTGAPLRTGARYSVYPKRYFESPNVSPEITLMVHGMRNDRAGATTKFAIAQRRLHRLGYRFPVIGYTYDSNVRGAHAAKTEAHALDVANIIAKKNGRHLAMLISDLKKIRPRMRIRLMGHSLGSIVIASALRRLGLVQTNTNTVESVHLFGASLELKDITELHMRNVLRRIVRGRIINYYSPDDEVLGYSAIAHHNTPIGLYGIASIRARPPHYVQRRVKPHNHRFASYAATLCSFP